jgi:phosphate transport system substrate-binding protein
MRKIIVCLLIILLAACSTKKAPPDTESEILDETNVNAAEVQELQKKSSENRDVMPRDTERYILYNGIRQYGRDDIFIRYYLRGVEASSERPDEQGEYAAQNLTDHTWRSWATGPDDNGIGEYFSFSFSLRYDSIVNVPVAGFVLKNGHGNLDHYTQYSRVKSFKIYADGEYAGIIPIKDSINFEQYIFEEPIACVELRFVIDDVYTGTEFDYTCIAEIALINQRVNDIEFYENILIWIGTGEAYPTQYENDRQEMVSVPDTEKLLLLDYLPFDISYYLLDWTKTEKSTIKTKIALLNGDSSLRLKDNLPRLDGATAMYPLYSSFVHAVYPEVSVPFDFPDVHYYEHLNLMGLHEWGYFPNERLILNRFWSGEGHLPILKYKSIAQCNTTSQAFQRLIDGETDIIFCYEPSTAEKNAAAKKGKRFNLTPIAYDAFVFIVNEKNNLNTITRRQIRDIYSGRVTNWKDISGADEPVIAYQRPENSGSQTILQSIMKEDKLMRPILGSETIVHGMSHMLNKISSDYYNYHSAIGYTFLFYLTQMAGDSGLKALSVDGIAPTRQTIQTKKYPFVQTVYAITTGNESENTKKFIAWILSAQGQELVAKTGYTPVK